jgi:hypothetical protein
VGWWRLVSVQNHYRVLGITLILRGGFNLLSAANFSPDWM